MNFRYSSLFAHLNPLETVCELQRAQLFRCPLLLLAFLFLVVRPGAPSSVLAPSSDALCS